MLKKFLYIIWLIFFIAFVIIFTRNANLKNLVSVMENRTFDMRQSILARDKTRTPSDKIVIVAIDDASYEYILNRYGEWPLPRDVYSKIAEYIETSKPQSIVFDLMFVNSLKSSKQADNAIIDTITNHNNIFTAMNFDNQENSLRIPPQLPDNVSVNFENKSKNVDLSYHEYSNCRKILDGILNNTSNIGITNVSRSDDGILRKMPVVVKYKDKYYPQLAFAAGLQYLKTNNIYDNSKIIIDEDSKIRIGNRIIPLDYEGSVILNWYGGAQSYNYIPLYKLIQAAEGEKGTEKFDFKDKIVYFGTTAVSLFDIKTVPVSKTYPGVEVQATYVNNIIDNNFIIRYDGWITLVIGLILSILTIVIVLSETSVIVGALASSTIYIIYLLSTYFVMKYFNIWLDVVYPIIFTIGAFMLAYIIKYLIKARDFEQQYLLATTDGLTELYNHRYFQEQMKQMVDSCSRYETSFSLIILDIDFFKKFNDTFGHQAGDAVLRQVAQTLKKNVRASDIVCRYGGEEMSIILSNTDYETAVSTAQKICDRVSSRHFHLPNGKETSVTISLGVSTYPQDGLTPSELIEAADKHLYKAKEEGRNRVGN